MTAAMRAMHPEVATIPDPIGTAFMHWGSDPLEIGWSFWRPGFVSDDMAAMAIQPDPRLPVHVAGETFARAQGWIEGALETAEIVTERILGAE